MAKPRDTPPIGWGLLIAGIASLLLGLVLVVGEVVVSTADAEPIDPLFLALGAVLMAGFPAAIYLIARGRK